MSEHRECLVTREDLVAYLLTRVSCLTKVSLMKLAYLADLEHMSRYGRPLSEASYTRDHHGAVDYLILDAAEAMPFVRVEPVITWFGSAGKEYRATSALVDPADRLTVQARAVLDGIVATYRTWSAADLGRLTKTTAPWKDAVERDSRVLRLAVVAPTNNLAHLSEVLKRVDRSTIGSAEDLARRDASVDDCMQSYRVRAMGH